MSNIHQRLLKMMGWKTIVPPERPSKSVICVAPHTSNIDFIIGKLYHDSLGIKSHFLMKKEWFFFPLGPLFRAMGGIPIDRSKKTSQVEQAAEMIQAADTFHLGITPEGTRSKSDRWKTGFYHIARLAHVPIELAKIDYKKKEVGIFEVFIPTGDVEADLAYIKSKYEADMAKKPQNFSK